MLLCFKKICCKIDQKSKNYTPGQFLPQEDIMEPISTTLVTALTAGAVASASKLGEQVISDAYGALKGLVAKKLGARSKVMKAVKELEDDPNSEGQKLVLKEKVEAAGIAEDEELVKAAQELLKVIREKPGGEQIIQTAIGNQNIQVTGQGNTVQVNTPRAKR
jgi:hypothetical protein